MAAIRSFLILLCSLTAANAVTVYSQVPFGASPTSTSASDPTVPSPSYSGLAAYDPTRLNPPAAPSPLPANQFGVFLMPTADLVNGLSIQTKSSFAGLSIEMSVTNQVCEYYPFRVLGVFLLAFWTNQSRFVST